MGNTTQAMFITFPANERPSWIMPRKQHIRKHYTSGIWKSLSSLITLYLLRHHTIFFPSIIIFIIITWIIFRPFIDLLKDPCDKSSFGSLSNCCAKWQGENFVAMGSRPFMAPLFFCQNHFVSRHWLQNLRLSSANIRPFFCLCLLYLFTSGEFPSSDTFIKTSR